MNKEERLRFVNHLKNWWQQQGTLTPERVAFLEQFLLQPDTPKTSFQDFFHTWQKDSARRDLTDDECEALVLEIMADDE